MPWADLVLGALLATACVRGLWRGLLGEAVSLLGLGVTALAVIHGTGALAGVLAARLGLPEGIGLVASALLLAGVTGLAGYLIRRWMHRRWKGLRRALPNRLGGGVAAVAKCAVLLSAVLVLAGPRLPRTVRAGLGRSVLAPRVAPIAPWLAARGLPVVPASTRAQAAALRGRLAAAWAPPPPAEPASPKRPGAVPAVTPPRPRRF
jgi:hypothetical protein